MDKAQLFKRLFTITMDELSVFTNFDETVSVAMLKLDLAARTRHIIHAVQLEDMWQSLDEESNLNKLYLSMRLSPMTLCSVLHFEEDMNCLEWRLVMPKYDDIDADDKPTCFGEYLEAIDRVEIIDIDDYDIEEVCSFIDQAYDFTPHRNHPRPWQSSL